MPSDETRIALMERKLDELAVDLDAERKDFKKLKESFDAQQREMATAKTVGRLVLWRCWVQVRFYLNCKVF